MKVIIFLGLFIINFVKAEYKCYSCAYHRDSNSPHNEIYSGIQHACYGEKHNCNIFGAACDFCWSDTKYYNEMFEYCNNRGYTNLNKDYVSIVLTTWNSKNCGH